MPHAEPHRLPATELVRLIEGGELTAEAVARSCLDRIAEREPVVRAWVHLDRDKAVAEARAKSGKGLLNGVPFGVKDIFDSADMPTGYGSPIYTGCHPSFSATAIALPRAAGGTLLGKTVTTEFANRHPGPTTNPHNAAHTPGGSSSGSAAAVGDFMVPLAIGTQTGGSVIRPAAYCGVVGYKPTFGDFSRVGIKMQCHSVDTLGLMARTLDDIALFRGAVLALPPVPVERDVSTPRVGFCRTPIWDEAEADTKALLEKTAAKLGAKDVSFTPAFKDILDDHGAITGW